MGSTERVKKGGKLSGRTMGFLILILLVVASWAVFKVITPGNFGSPKNLLSYFESSLMISAGAAGFYFVMVMGMFDFSIGANIMLSAIVGTTLASRFNMGYFGLIVGCILTGAIVGLLNGFFYVKLHIPSMIVTTGLALIYESIASYIAGGQSATLPSNLRKLGAMPGDLILAVIAFVISGAFFGIEAILTISYGSSMVAETGMASMSRNFYPTMGCFLGLALKKYGIPIPAIIIGEFFLQIIYYGFVALGAPTAVNDVISGLALLIIVTLTTKVGKGEIVK